MAIENGNYIKLSYTGSVNGVPFDATGVDEAKKAGIFRENAMYGPVVVKVGVGRVLPGVDEDLVGKEIGREYTVVVPAAKAFGEHKKADMKAIDKKTLPQKVSVLDCVTVEGREGIVVNKVGGRYLVDFNHPLAGQAVSYVYKIEALVEDPIEMLAGTIRLFTGREMKVCNVPKDFVSIEIPPMMAMYNQNWTMTEYLITQEAFGLFPEIAAVKFVETFTRPHPKIDGEVEEGGAVPG
ncbi:MAG: FKBP-type peptidyl-prolyl cis-trans isomerase [Methanocalculaceae archaeon]|jgi:FKBP-type peptidyl-prolyl cis-trans isomerase 2|nr:FKBP-type peptidyl-prolyl cis-trans isomerase [Methanocalculaceae archaeon]